MNAPKRKYTLKIEIGGDTWEDVLHDLQFLSDHIPDHGPRCDSVCGGVSGGHMVEVIVDDTMTHERYHQLSNEYLKQVRKDRP
jgi:hypothetical protein